MKILFIARTCPFPANDGEKVRVYNIIRNLAHHEITLVCRSMTPKDKEGVIELRKYCKNVHAVHIPSPSSLLQKMLWVFPFVFSKYPISLSTVFFNKINNTIKDLCETEDFDIIQIEHSSLTIYLDNIALSKMPKTILTMHNIDYVRNDRVIENLSLGVSKLFQLLNQKKFKKWEIKSLQRYDHIIAMSGVDKQIMLNDVPSLEITVVPNGVDTALINFDLTKRLGAGSKKILFVASMDNDANHDASIYFIDQIFPYVKKECSGAILYIVGRSPRNELVNKHNGNDVVVTGMVESVYEYYREAAVAIVPLRSGGGTRLKILEAMAIGVPVVSTTIGAEGINVISGKDILLADTPEGFAQCVVRMLTDISESNSLVKEARRKVEQEYDWKIIAKQHELVYRSL